jgi:metal-responsive CopG/Arc/MetJ family transcriptional regulator
MVTCDNNDATERRVGRRKLWDIRMIVRLRKEMADDIDSVLQPKNGGKLEDRSDLVRIAIQKEIDFRRRKRRKRAE